MLKTINEFSFKERITAHASSFPNHMRVWQPDVFGFAVCFFAGRLKYVSVSLLHFLLIDLRRVEQEADSNLHVCLCNCRQRRARSVGPQYSWWCWVSMLRSQRRCRLQTSIWLYRPRDTPTSHYIWFYLSAPDWIWPPHVHCFCMSCVSRLVAFVWQSKSKYSAVYFSRTLIWDQYLLTQFEPEWFLQLNPRGECNSSVSPADGRKHTCLCSHIGLQPSADVGRAVDL